MWSKYSAELHNHAELVLLLVCDLVALHPCLCKSCNREMFPASVNKNKKYWCFVLPWFSMSVEIEAQQQSSLQWGYKVSWLSKCWTWIPHLQKWKVRQTSSLSAVGWKPYHNSSFFQQQWSQCVQLRAMWLCTEAAMAVSPLISLWLWLWLALLCFFKFPYHVWELSFEWAWWSSFWRKDILLQRIRQKVWAAWINPYWRKVILLQ